jgi:hypothetical protein
VNCPWCSWASPPRALHAHLAEAHPEGVKFEERAGRHAYVVTCPRCQARHVQAIKPGADDPDFLVDYEREIRLVGFDMLVNHLLAEHGEEP